MNEADTMDTTRPFGRRGLAGIDAALIALASGAGAVAMPASSEDAELRQDEDTLALPLVQDVLGRG